MYNLNSNQPEDILLSLLIHIYLIRYGFGITSDFSFNLSSWLVFLGIFNSVVNPFIYAYQRKDFRSGCQKLCCGSGRRAASAKSTEETEETSSRF